MRWQFTINEINCLKKHIVVFQDEEGNVLKTSFVSHEEAALPPEMPEKRGRSVHHEIKFQGWDKDISSVKENLVSKGSLVRKYRKNIWSCISMKMARCLEQRQFLTGRRQHSLSPAKTADRGVLLHI